MIINQSNLDALTTGFNVAFTQGLTLAESTYQDIAMTVPSSTRENLYAWLGNSFKIREWIGDRHLQGLATHDFKLKNRPFEGTVEVDRFDILDDQYGVYTPMFQQMGDDAKVHPDTLMFPLLNAGFSNLCYDGQTFFNANHPVGDGAGGTTYVSNMQDGSGPPWFLVCTKRAVRPFIFQKRQEYQFVPLINPSDPNVFFQRKFIYGVDARNNVGYGLWQLAFGSKADLTPTNYEAAWKAMLEFRNDNGLPMAVVPDTLVVPPTHRAAGKRLVETQLQFTSSTGGDNINYGTAKLMVSPYLILS